MPAFALRPSTLACLLTTALIGGCGGGSDNGPTPPRQVQVLFSSPADTDNVHTLGTGIALTAAVTADGAAAADGTTVTWSAPAAQFAPAQSSTRSGQASTTMVGHTAVPVQVQATASASGLTGSSSRTLYLRPAPLPLEVLVPAYFYPLPTSPWDQLTASAQAHPGLRITAIVNPSNGPSSRVDPQFTRALSAFTQAGGKAIGYVSTRYGTGARSLDTIQRDIDRYLAFYGNELISGFFLDEMAATGNRLAFYRSLHDYIKGKGSQLRIIGNPGAFTVGDYAGVADSLVVFEGPASNYSNRFDPQPANTWVYAQTNTAQAMLVHDAAHCSAMQAALRTAATARSNTGMVYATDAHYDPATQTGNPWAALPSYWLSLLDTVNALNRGSAMPPC